MARIRRLAGIVAATLAGIASLAGWAVHEATRTDGPRLAQEAARPLPDRPDDPPVLVMLRPGTDVETAVPPGWSDLVVKSVMALESGDLDTLPAFAKVTATRFRTLVVADVGRDPGQSRFRLRRVGAGLALNIKGRDTTISSETARSQGVNLGTIDALVLGRAERALGRSRLIAATPTFALYETFVELAGGDGVHHPTALRYALVVDPETGRLRSACWAIAEKPEDREPIATMSLLSPGLIFHCGIHVSARRLVGNLAASWGFAMTTLPPGEAAPVPPSLRDLAAAEPGVADAPRLEAAVREAMRAKP